MNNNFLKYMLDNNPDSTVSEKSIERRNRMRPLLLKILALSNKLDLVIEKNEFKGSNMPVIYLASHAFKDDVLNTVLTANDDLQIVFGNIDLFFNTLDGFFLWLYGCQLVDRYDKESRHAMKAKMNRIMECKSNILIFPEATWNLSPNKLMYNLHWGFYDVAQKNNAVVVPIITYKVGEKCYSRMLSEIDINNIDEADKELMIKRINKYFNKAINLLKLIGFNNKYLEKNLAEMICQINELNKENIDEKYESIKSSCLKVVNEIKNINDENIPLVIKLLSRIETIRKEVITEKIRDIMATEKYDMISMHPDNSYQNISSNKYEEWDKYLEETINATPYFYLEPEKTTEFIDDLCDYGMERKLKK